MKYAPPGEPGSIVELAPRYENFIGGKWLAPTHGRYRVDLTPAMPESLPPADSSGSASAPSAIEAPPGVLTWLARYDVLHFAAHTRVDEDHPWCGRILLDGGGDERRGLSFPR